MIKKSLFEKQFKKYMLGKTNNGQIYITNGYIIIEDVPDFFINTVQHEIDKLECGTGLDVVNSYIDDSCLWDRCEDTGITIEPTNYNRFDRKIRLFKTPEKYNKQILPIDFNFLELVKKQQYKNIEWFVNYIDYESNVPLLKGVGKQTIYIIPLNVEIPLDIINGIAYD